MVSEIVKRDGRRVPYDAAKIEVAVLRCLQLGCGWSDEPARRTAERVAHMVDGVVQHKGGSPSVEQIQDWVVMQLAALGRDAEDPKLIEAVVAYQNYREEHRLKRLFRPVSAEESAYINRTGEWFPEPCQVFNFLTKYARWDEEKGRRETWEECVERAITFLQAEVARRYPEGERTVSQTGRVFLGNPLPAEHPVWDELRQGILRQEAMPAMRLLQMAGPAAQRCNVSIYNCSFSPLSDAFAFAELLYVLMAGSGGGYSVEGVHVDQLPRVARQNGKPKTTFVVPDDTEGWCEALHVGLQAWLSGRDVEFDYSLIRPAGARLRTKGGRASGPEPLRAMLDFTRKVVLARQGKVLTSADALRIACMIGKIVQVGGVRRASEIAISDLADEEVRHIKRGAYWERGEDYLSEANISAAYDEKPTAIAFMREWLALAESGTGERGILNRSGLPHQLPVRRVRRLMEFFGCSLEELLRMFGLNPCGEINLITREFCNLSIAVARRWDSFLDLVRKVRLASILGTLQSLLTDFGFLRPEWKEHVELERLLGVDLMGDLECELLRPWTSARKAEDPEGAAAWDRQRADLLQELRQVVIDTNREFASILGIYESTATTCRKPGGNSEWTLMASSLKLREGRFQIRRFRNGAQDPVSHLLRSEGVPCQPENGHDPESPATWVFSFPIEHPEGTLTNADLTAIDQLENWRIWKRNWCEHNPSCTIRVADDEWLAVGNWVYQNWEDVGGLSFQPVDNGVYLQVPNEEVTEDEYRRLVEAFPKEISWAKLVQFEADNEHVNPHREKACFAGVCEL